MGEYPVGWYPPRPVPWGSALPLDATAALVGGYRWIEQALFVLLGSWVTEATVPEVQVHLDAQSARHAWHAELWAERLPVRDGADPDSLSVAPSPVDEVLTALAGHDGADHVGDSAWSVSDGGEGDGPGVLPRLAGLYRVVLPRLVVTYQRHLGMTSSITDGPLIRALRLVLADEIEDWHAGELLLQRLVTRVDDVAAVHAVHQHLEMLVVGSGVVTGLVNLPGIVRPG